MNAADPQLAQRNCRSGMLASARDSACGNEQIMVIMTATMMTVTGRDSIQH